MGNGTLVFVPAFDGMPAWPEATRAEARLRVTGQRVEFSDARARVYGTELSRIAGRIDLVPDQVPLTLDLQARGSAQDMLRFIKASAIDQWTDRALGGATATGAATLGLKLDMPLLGSDPARGSSCRGR